MSVACSPYHYRLSPRVCARARADYDAVRADAEVAARTAATALVAARTDAETARQQVAELRAAAAAAQAAERLLGSPVPLMNEPERVLEAALGGVNLRADEEAEEVAKQLDGLVKERDDLIQAINKLRGGISSLNREGRQRQADDPQPGHVPALPEKRRRANTKASASKTSGAA